MKLQPVIKIFLDKIMEEKKLKEIQSLLKTIILKNQTSNVLDNKLVIGLKLENNTVHFTLELLPEQLKESQEIKKIIEEKLLGIKAQYLIFASGCLNIRKFTGYHINLIF